MKIEYNNIPKTFFYSLLFHPTSVAHKRSVLTCPYPKLNYRPVHTKKLTSTALKMPISSDNFETAILRLATKANISPEEAMQMVSDLLPANLRAKYSDEEKPAPKKKREGPTLRELQQRAQAVGINGYTSMKRDALISRLATCDEENLCPQIILPLSPSDWTAESLRRLCKLHSIPTTGKNKETLCNSVQEFFSPKPVACAAVRPPPPPPGNKSDAIITAVLNELVTKVAGDK